jgi:hypothetical protein
VANQGSSQLGHKPDPSSTRPSYLSPDDFLLAFLLFGARLWPQVALLALCLGLALGHNWPRGRLSLPPLPFVRVEIKQRAILAFAIEDTVVRGAHGAGCAQQGLRLSDKRSQPLGLVTGERRTTRAESSLELVAYSCTRPNVIFVSCDEFSLLGVGRVGNLPNGGEDRARLAWPVLTSVRPPSQG